MPILYAMVAEGSDVLAEEPSSQKDYAQTARQVLSKIERKNQKRTLTHQGVNFNLKYSGTYFFLCVSDADFSLQLAFKFLQDIEETTIRSSGNIKSLLRKKIAQYNDPRADEVKAVRGEIDQVKGIMMENIDKVLERQQRLDTIVDKTEDLKGQASQFRSGARELKRHFCCQNFKLTLILIAVAVIVLFFIIIAGCGGFSFPRCS